MKLSIEKVKQRTRLMDGWELKMAFRLPDLGLNLQQLRLTIQEPPQGCSNLHQLPMDLKGPFLRPEITRALGHYGHFPQPLMLPGWELLLCGGGAATAAMRHPRIPQHSGTLWLNWVCKVAPPFYLSITWGKSRDRDRVHLHLTFQTWGPKVRHLTSI